MKKLMILIMILLPLFIVYANAYTVTIAASYPTAVDIYDDTTLLSSGENTGVSGPVLVKLVFYGTLLARYTLDQDLDLTNADYETATDVDFGGGALADTFVDDSDYTSMALKEGIFPSDTTHISICNEKGHVATDIYCGAAENIFSFDTADAPDSITQNGKTIDLELKDIGGTNYYVVSGELDEANGYVGEGGVPEVPTYETNGGSGGEVIPEFSTIGIAIVMMLIIAGVIFMIKKK